MKVQNEVYVLLKKSFKLWQELPPTGIRTEKDVFYLNDFYDLLYEKENTMTRQGLNEPEYFEREKYYTMGPGIDFPMIMSYKDTENPNFDPYYYFLNGHNDVVFLADANFTEGKTESYEYNPWGVLLTQASKNNLLFRSKYYDSETGNIMLYNSYYKPDIGIFYNKVKAFNKLRRLYISKFSLRSTDGLIPGKQPNGDRDECFRDCNDEYIDDLTDCEIIYDAWDNMCLDGYLDKLKDCSDRDEIFSFINFECYSNAWEYYEECFRLTEDELQSCQDDAWEEYIDCWNSCL